MKLAGTSLAFLAGASPGCLCYSAKHEQVPTNANTGKKPSIMLIMADDMGYSDAGCYGGEIQTPNLDRLGANGLRFTQFYNCARCCPTRASLLTGQYPHKVGLARNGQSLNRNGITLAEALKRAGYQTAMVGKWHLSVTKPLQDKALHQKWLNHQYDPGQPFAPLETYPVNRGFDKHYGVIWGVINFFDPFSLVEGAESVKTVPEDYYFTDAITDKAVQYIREFNKSDKPFFLYIAHCAPHWPLHALPGDIAKYKDTYKDGWHKLRKDRYERQLKMGLFERENTPLPPIQGEEQGVANWNEMSEKDRAYQVKKMAVHAAMVDRIDQSLGRILDALQEAGQMNNTIILFLSDNGASPETPRGAGYDRTGQRRDGHKVTYETLAPASPDARRGSGKDQDIPLDVLGSQLSYAGIGGPWASASNTPYRYWKKESFEGGCHTPLVVYWPKGLKIEPGSITHEVSHVIDVMPTCLELAGVSYPDKYDGHALTSLDGKSMVPIFKGKKRELRSSSGDRLFFEHMGGRAVRMDDWKLVALEGRPWELYNLADDQTETKNLAAKYPQRVQMMSKEWENWAQSMGLAITTGGDDSTIPKMSTNSVEPLRLRLPQPTNSRSWKCAAETS